MSPPQDHITSPLEEEDISRAAVLHDGSASGTRDPNEDPRRKQKQRAQDPFDDEHSASSSDEAEAGVKTYPPRKSEEEESRKVQEVCLTSPERHEIVCPQRSFSLELATMGTDRMAAAEGCAGLVVVRRDVVSRRRCHSPSQPAVVGEPLQARLAGERGASGPQEHRRHSPAGRHRHCAPRLSHTCARQPLPNTQHIHDVPDRPTPLRVYDRSVRACDCVNRRDKTKAAVAS